ncbi:MAG: SDR family oxidoreductase [Anaerolineae bacterium]|nr:SDR family oxidoreductase [Anaerolineae bacterium]
MGESAFDLTGRTALVTGGNTGIGLGIALGLARAGARVAITARNEARNRDALAQLLALRQGCQAFVHDLDDNDGIPEHYALVSREMGGIDILVNNAGMQCRGRADTIALEDLNQIIRVNLVAPYVLSQCFARSRIANGTPGSIIMIASLMSEAARPTTSAYTATKGGIRQLVRALAVDWAEFGIRVNGIGPGYIHTGMTQVLVDDPEFDAWVKRRTPLGRWGTPDDFAGAAVFLASEASRFVTGQILYVDGGWLATF